LEEAEKVIEGGGRVMVTTLTKKMAEDLAEFLKDRKIKAAYLHSDVETLDRITTLTDLRKGSLRRACRREPASRRARFARGRACGNFDADKSGFLRSETSLIQTIGRAARNVKGRVFLYADEMTPQLKTQSTKPIAAAPSRLPTTKSMALPRQQLRKTLKILPKSSAPSMARR
jgi:excinuclease ABC subunit B